MTIDSMDNNDVVYYCCHYIFPYNCGHYRTERHSIISATDLKQIRQNLIEFVARQKNEDWR